MKAAKCSSSGLWTQSDEMTVGVNDKNKTDNIVNRRMAKEHRAGSRVLCEHHRVLHSVPTRQQVASAAVHILLLPWGIICENRAGKKSGKNILFFYCHLGAKDWFCQHDKRNQTSATERRIFAALCKYSRLSFWITSKNRFDHQILLLADDTVLSLLTDGQ